MINEALSLLNCSDAIKFDSLFNELKILLRKAIPGVDLMPLDNNRRAIAGILLCLLNNIDFSLMPEVKAKTVLSLNDADESANVYGQYYITHEKEPFTDVAIMSPVFQSGYDVSDLFDEHVTNENIVNGDVEFSFDLGKIVVSKS